MSRFLFNIFVITFTGIYKNFAGIGCKLVEHLTIKIFFEYQQDIETFDLEDFKYNSVNITAFRLVDVESPKVSDIIDQMKRFQHSGQDILNGSSVIMVSNRKLLILRYFFHIQCNFLYDTISTG